MRPHLVGYALVAGWLALSRLHRLQSADSLIFSLSSLYEWTPFFWEQDRVGLLLPLLVSPVRDPFGNLLVLTGLMSFCGLLTPLLMARLVCPRPHAYAAVTLGNALFLALAPDLLHENMLVVCNYPLGLVLGLSAVRLLDAPTRRRAVAALLLLVLAHWVYIGVAVYLAAFVGCRWLVERDRRSFAAAARTGAGLATAVGLLLVLMAAWRARHPEIADTPAGGLSFGDWPASWGAFVTALWRLDRFGWWVAATAGVTLVGVVVGLWRDWGGVRRVVRAVSPLVFAAAAELLFLGSREWTAANFHHPRYLVAVVTAGWTAALVVAGTPLAAAAIRPHRLMFASLALLAAAAAVRYGPPSPAAARAALDEVTGTDGAELLSGGYEGIGGEYMHAWPAVFHTNLVLHEQGDRRVVVGGASRAAPWVHRWQAGELRHGFRLAAPFDQEEQARRWIAHYGLTVTAGPLPHGRLIVFTVVPAG